MEKVVYSFPLDGGRNIVKFYASRTLSEDEWSRVYKWLEILKSGLTPDAVDETLCACDEDASINDDTPGICGTCGKPLGGS